MGLKTRLFNSPPVRFARLLFPLGASIWLYVDMASDGRQTHTYWKYAFDVNNTFNKWAYRNFAKESSPNVNLHHLINQTITNSSMAVSNDPINEVIPESISPWYFCLAILCWVGSPILYTLWFYFTDTWNYMKLTGKYGVFGISSL